MGSATSREAAPLPSEAFSASTSSATANSCFPTAHHPNHPPLAALSADEWRHIPICRRCTTLKPFCSRSGDVLGFSLSEDGTDSLSRSRALMSPGAGPSAAPSGPKPLVTALLSLFSPGAGL